MAIDDKKAKRRKNKCQLKLRTKRKSQKLCTSCGEPAIKGKTLCEKHSNSKRANSSACRKRQKENGLCVNCTKPIYRKGANLCVKHFNITKIRRKNEISRRIQNGKCIHCEQPATFNNVCESHHQQNNTRSNNRVKMKLSKNECLSCSDPAIHAMHCLKHLIIKQETASKYNSNHKEEISKKNKEQRINFIKDNRCASCGIPLNDDIDKGKFQCINCREKLHITKQPIKGILDYAANKESSTEKLQHI